MRKKRKEDPTVLKDRQELSAMEDEVQEVQHDPELLEGEVFEEGLPEMVQMTIQEYELLVSRAKAALDAEQQVLRWQADFENYRRRMQREREELAQYASADLISGLLPILDNFDRALAASYADPATLRAGVEMIQKQQLDLLSREGLTLVHPLGEQFNPNLHEAVARCDAENDTPDNTVVEVLQRGYLLKDRLLRPALVKVAQRQQ